MPSPTDSALNAKCSCAANAASSVLGGRAGDRESHLDPCQARFGADLGMRQLADEAKAEAAPGIVRRVGEADAVIRHRHDELIAVHVGIEVNLTAITTGIRVSNHVAGGLGHGEPDVTGELSRVGMVRRQEPEHGVAQLRHPLLCRWDSLLNPFHLRPSNSADLKTRSEGSS